ncbi:MAG: cbb3-type cytochrome c oxidase subunit I [Rhodomicrobium sp.]
MTDSRVTLPESMFSVAKITAQASVPLAELKAWAALAIGSLGLAGVMAVLLAVSRIPGIEAVAFWPLDFFAKGLVIHVVFSLVVWFLTLFALLASLAAAKIPQGGLRFASLGGIGAVAVAVSYPLLFLTAFDSASEPSLNNYIPVIQHPAYYTGLALLGLGILMPVLRLLLNVPARPREMPPFAFAMSAGSVIYLIAMICFGIAAYLSWGAPPSKGLNEVLFWGGGHILQFLFCLVMLTGWFVLGRSSLGEAVIGADVFRVAVLVLLAFTLPAPFFFPLFDMSSMWFREAFSKLQFVMALPTMLVAVPLLFGIGRAKEKAPLPWRDPAFLALVLSLAVFAAGGLMGNLISGSDTRTPAHYHAVIAGVNLAAMGLVLTYCLPALGRRPHPSRWLRLQIWLYGAGQLAACIGLFWAGGYGAPRKTPTSLGSLADGAVMGMYLNGIGALFAVAGGVIFVITVAAALLRKDKAAGERGGAEQRLAELRR